MFAYELSMHLWRYHLAEKFFLRCWPAKFCQADNEAAGCRGCQVSSGAPIPDGIVHGPTKKNGSGKRKHLDTTEEQRGRSLISSISATLTILRIMNTRSQFRGGMQVHAVPETERAIGANGQRLPWAYEYAESSHIDSREKGPFGRSTRRRTPSRSKTATPSRKEDKDAAENWRAIDDIFKRAKEADEARELARSTAAPVAGVLPAPESQEIKSTPAGTPTEVILYGFAPGFQYAAIEFYERASRGIILEDYDRYPPNPRYSNSLSMRQSRGPGLKLSKEALRKKNTHRGGTHWIKVTFDSAEAADLACAASPHVINGYIVHAELYRGEGPAGGDVAILATPQALASATASPSQRSSTTARDVSTETASTATATTAATILPDPFVAPSTQRPTSPTSTVPVQNTSVSSSMALKERPLRIRGAKRAVLLPADQALVPGKNATQRFIEAVPILGWFFSGSSDLIGEGVPRRDDETVDWDSVGIYWKFWWWIDWWFGTDYCGLKGDD
ncbi:uncharacterized protein PV09_00086 [Verruconis gallopava]|uniref:Uncharacterized protein n=1 Tax=Verruconis gallopava TaxID=253628 RepID=A0A0D2ARL0_9PEZI|nr:uncharacterized protein PV09_00086 [Verruconis gallopava]KIW09150.1 hypothetical protein PV09_00086 [Verruconis gallopava]